MTFLPEGTKIPQGKSLYMKFSEPENRFRVLGESIVGYELWVNGKPVRKHNESEFTKDELENADINKFTNKKKEPAYFWAFPVYNYQTKQVEILEVTQITVMRGIEDYYFDKDYADPIEYDLIVVRDDSGDKTQYRVKAKPPVAIDPGIKQLYKDMHINLNALFEGTDPFSSEKQEKGKVNIDDIPDF